MSQLGLTDLRLPNTARHIPEAFATGISTRCIELQKLSWPREFDILDDGARAAHETVRNDARDATRIEARIFQQFRRQQGAQFGCESERPIRIRMRRPREIERLDAERIPRQHQAAGPRSPTCKREHAAQPADCLGSVQTERAQHNRSIARRLERLSFRLEAGAKFAKVIDLAVEDDDVAGDRIGHRLHARRRKIENGEPAMREQSTPVARVRLGCPHSLRIWTTVRERTAHAAQRSAICVIQPSDNPSDTTHQPKPSGCRGATPAVRTGELHGG